MPDIPSLEQSVKSQFERVFPVSDWELFKEMAEASFSEAAFLKTSAFKKVADNKKLLARNSRKRLLIGVGAELLLKAVYLKTGYCINKPKVPKHTGPTFPFKLAATDVPLNKADTYMLDHLITGLPRIVTLQDLQVVTEGLRIAKVFRNKEGHVVTRTHKFESQSFRAIECALVALYADVFGQQLMVRFSFEPKEKAAWKTTKVT